MRKRNRQNLKESVIKENVKCEPAKNLKLQAATTDSIFEVKNNIVKILHWIRVMS